MWPGRIAVAALLFAFCAWFAWLISQPFDAKRALIAIAVFVIAIGVGALLSRGALGTELRRWGLGPSSTTYERRLSTASTIVAAGSALLMQAVLGRPPAFLPAFAWLSVTFALLPLLNFRLRRRAPTA